MNRKSILLAAILFVVATTGVFAFGVGLQFNGNAARVFEPGAAVTLKLDSVPLYFAVNWYVGHDTSIGLTGDYWIVNKKLTDLGSNPLNWFVGIGFFSNMTFSNDFLFEGGLRVPLGVNMFLADGFFEPFLQVAPSFGVKFIPSLGMTRPFFPLSIGFRMWFK